MTVFKSKFLFFFFLNKSWSMTWNIKLHNCKWWYLFSKTEFKKKSFIFVQVWFFCVYCFFGFSLKADILYASQKMGAEDPSAQYMRTIIVYSVPSMSAEMQWIVWFNIRMWFIFTVNVKSFNFSSVHIHCLLWLQTSRLWMIQIVHNNKMSSRIHFLQWVFCLP